MFAPKTIRRSAQALAILAVATAAWTGVKAQTKAPVYVVIDISETMDAEAYVKAVSAAEPKATHAAGGRFVIRSNKAVALDGDTAPNRFVLIAFDNEDQARAWRASVSDVNAVRLKATKSRSFMVEGLAN